MTPPNPQSDAPTRMEMTMDELLPCPFCGEAPKWRGTRSDYARGLFRLQCLGETHLVQSYGPTESAAIAAWNTRPAQAALSATPMQAMRDALKTARDAVCIAYCKRSRDGSGNFEHSYACRKAAAALKARSAET